MKFATQHKFTTGLNRIRPKEKYWCHRNGNIVWVTGDDGQPIVSNSFNSVRMAKSWMNMPTLKF